MTTVQSDFDSDFDARAKSWDDDPMKIERAQSVARAMLATARWFPGMQGLEFGCGTGQLSFGLRERFERITLADTSVGMLEVLQQKIAALGASNMHPVWLDENAESLKNQRFDMIYSLMTLHHIADVDSQLAQWALGLGEGGQLCIADLDAEDGSFHDGDPSVHPGFDRVELARRVASAGFDKIRFSTVFEIRKGTPERVYPVFLKKAEKR